MPAGLLTSLSPYSGTCGSNETVKLAGDDVVAGDQFGHKVSLDGDVATDPGAVYIFERSCGVWNQVTKILNPDPKFGDHFGSSLELVGDTL